MGNHKICSWYLLSRHSLKSIISSLSLAYLDKYKLQISYYFLDVKNVTKCMYIFLLNVTSLFNSLKVTSLEVLEAHALHLLGSVKGWLLWEPKVTTGMAQQGPFWWGHNVWAVQSRAGQQWWPELSMVQIAMCFCSKKAELRLIKLAGQDQSQTQKRLKHSCLTT